jgi:hypothetical protein
MAQAGGSYNNPLKKFKSALAAILYSLLEMLTIEQISLPRRAKWYAARQHEFHLEMLIGIYSRENVPYHPFYVRLFRQHVPGDNRYRFPLKSKRDMAERWEVILTDVRRLCTSKIEPCGYNYGTRQVKNGFGV